MMTVWLEVERQAGEPPSETVRREVPDWVAVSFAEHGMPLSMLDRQSAEYVRAWLRAMLAVRITDDGQMREEIEPVVEDCKRNPKAIVRVAA